MGPKFSIIVPVYNVHGYIETTISSILSQTFDDFELLAVDDGSTDGSGEYLDNIATADCRVKVFHQPNSGVSAARNLGLDNALGEWIVFVDGDDALKINALEILVNTIKECPSADLIGFGFDKAMNICSDGVICPADNSKRLKVEFDCRERACFAALNHYMVWTEIYRRDLINGIRFKGLRNGEDVLFCNEIGLRARYYVELRANLYIYLQRETSAKNNEWNICRQEDYVALHRSIYENLNCNRGRNDNVWVKRWIGGLLFFEPKVWNFDKSNQLKYYDIHRDILKKAKTLPGISKLLTMWIAIALAVRSRKYYKLTAMLPMKLYNNLRK